MRTSVLVALAVCVSDGKALGLGGCPPLEFSGEETIEPEACGEDTNGGCNMDKEPRFTPIRCYEVIKGTAWLNDGTRDTDWFVFEVTKDTEIRIVGESVLVDHIFGVVEDSDTQDCEAIRFVRPLASDPCGPGRAVVQTVLRHTDRDGGDPSTTRWWLFAAPGFAGPGRPCNFDDPDAHNAYLFTLECPGLCPWDQDTDGDVGFTDLLRLLGDWGPCQGECPADFDGDGLVGFDDVLILLAEWGPCP